MNRLEAFGTSLLNMTEEELHNKIISIREDRKVSKKAITVKVAQKRNREEKFVDKFAKMSDAEKEEFKKLMGVG